MLLRDARALIRSELERLSRTPEIAGPFFIVECVRNGRFVQFAGGDGKPDILFDVPPQGYLPHWIQRHSANVDLLTQLAIDTLGRLGVCESEEVKLEFGTSRLVGQA